MEENLQQERAVEKFRYLVKDIRVCMFITDARTGEHDHTRPMSTADVEEDGTLWFYTDVRSVKVEEIAAEHDVHLTYAHPGKESYLDIWGKGSIVKDKEQLKSKWTPAVKVYFSGGVDDPNLALLKVKPNDVYYWDAGHNKMTVLLKMAASLITGKQLADGKEGTLAINKQGA